MPEDMSHEDESDVKREGPSAATVKPDGSIGGVSTSLPIGAAQVRQFFSLAPFAVAIFDRDMRYMAASKKWLSDYRLEGKRVLGRTQYDIFPNMADEWRDRYRRCLAGEHFEDQEDRFDGPDGTEWVSWNMNPWTDDDGEVAGLILFSEFISDKKKKAAELESNQAFLKAVLDSVHDGIVACDADGELTVFNAATKDLHGLPAEPIPAENWADHYDLFQPDGTTPLEKEQIPLFRAFNGEAVHRAEMVIAPTDREPRRILARGRAMYDADGNKIGAVASMRDITEEREAVDQLQASEGQFRKLYNETPAMLQSVDGGGKLIRVSDFWLQTLGYERDEVIGTPFFELLPDESREYFLESVLPDFVEKGRLDNVEFKVNKKDGSAIDVQLSVVGQRDVDGVVQSAITVLTDITAIKLAETELRRSEELFRILYHETPAMLHSVDREGKLIRVSDFWLQSFGYEEADVIGHSFHEFLTPSSKKYASTILFPEFIRTGQLKDVDLEVVKKTGEIINVQVTTSAERDENDEVVNSLSVLTDTTARKKVERQLKRSEEQFRGAFEASPQGMGLVSPSAEWMMVNDALCDMLGYSQGELLDMSARDLTHPDDLEQDLTNVRRVLDGECDSYQVEKRYLHKDGSKVWAYTSVILIRNEKGDPVHFVTQVLDRTKPKQMERALRRSEEQFRSAYETSPLGIALVSPQGRWLAANPALCDILGCSEKELIKKGIRDLTHPEDLDTEVEDIKGLLRGERQSFQMEKRYLHANGSVRWGLVSIALIRDHIGEPVQFVFQLLDLTQRRETEEQLLQAQKLEAVGQLTGGIAHDFNNLLAVILISLQLLERTHGDEEKSLKRIKAALDATERGADLTRRLLAFSRKQSLEQKVIDVKRLLKGMTGLLQRSIGGGIKLESHYAKDLWKIESDQSQLETGVLNLAINARDAMPDGGDLTIEARNVVLDEAYAGVHTEVEPGRYVLVAVTDTGSGIPADIVEKVFQPFFTTKEVGRGTGLGLSMVYGFMKQSKGHIEVYSELGVGTSIKLYLPALDDGKLADVERSAEVTGDITGQGEIILVTEDDGAVRESVAALFKSLNYAVIEAADAAEALVILKSDTKIDLLFSDIVMPGGMNGVELANETQAIRPDLKILLTTGFAEVAIARGKLPTVVTEIIGKPYRRGDLARKVRGVLDV